MNIRLLSIIGAAMLLALTGCVVADHDGKGYYGSYGYHDPWLYGSRPYYSDDYFRYTAPGYVYPYPSYWYPYPFFIDNDHRNGKNRHDVRHHGETGHSEVIVTSPAGSTGQTGSGHGNQGNAPGENRHFVTRHDHDRDHDEQLARPPALQCHEQRC